jgi:hypothetical protein
MSNSGTSIAISQEEFIDALLILFGYSTEEMWKGWPSAEAARIWNNLGWLAGDGGICR